MPRRKLPLKNHKRSRLSDHHMVPRARGGTRQHGNILRLPDKLHRAWHTLFDAMTPEEAMCCIAAHFFPPNRLTFVLIRNAECEIRLTADHLNYLRGLPATREAMPNFDELGTNPFVFRTYERRTRRTKPKPAPR